MVRVIQGCDVVKVLKELEEYCNSNTTDVISVQEISSMQGMTAFILNCA